MSRKPYLVFVLAGCLFLALPLPAQAYRSIMEAWQAHYDPCQTLITADCTVCHQGGFSFNSYGADLRTRINNQGMANVAAFIDAETEDSDGDGYINSQEILIDCTLPGDATSHGTVDADGSAWGAIKALYR